MADSQTPLRKSARIRNRAAALAAEREREEAKEKQLKDEKQQQQQQQRGVALEAVQVQKANRAKAVHAARMKSTTAIKSLPRTRVRAARVSSSGHEQDSDVGTMAGESASDSEEDSDSDDSDEDSDDDADHEQDEDEEEDDEMMAIGSKRSKSKANRGKRTQRWGGARSGKRLPTKTVLRSRRGNPSQRPTRPGSRRFRNGSSSSFNFDEVMASLNRTASPTVSPSRSMSPMSDDKNHGWTSEAWARHSTKGYLQLFLTATDHKLTPLSMVIYHMPRVENSYPADILDLWTTPVKALSGGDWEVREVIDTLRSDQIAHWLRISLQDFLGFRVVATTKELNLLNMYLNFRLVLMRTAQAMPSCFEWLKTDVDPQPGEPAYEVLYRIRSLDDEYQRLLIWALENSIRTRLTEDRNSTTPQYAHRSIKEDRLYRSELHYLLKSIDMFRARISPVMEWRASQTILPGFIDERPVGRWGVKVDVMDPSLEELEAHQIEQVVNADIDFLNTVERVRNVYLQTTMLSDEQVIAGLDPRLPVALLTTAPQPQQPQQPQAGSPIPCATLGSTAATVVDPSGAATATEPPGAAPGTTQTSIVAGATQYGSLTPQLSKLGFGLKTADEWIAFARKVQSQDDNWWRYELVGIMDYHKTHLNPEVLQMELPLLNDHAAFMEKGILLEKQRYIGKLLLEHQKKKEQEELLTQQEEQSQQQQMQDQMELQDLDQQHQHQHQQQQRSQEPNPSPSPSMD
ncbi:hypothetical protein BGX33_004512 [Mortierella sp. NVP41]|nr:hypothetical protein BGX33_004512 [Mortierella sp. NVP41]